VCRKAHAFGCRQIPQRGVKASQSSPVRANKIEINFCAGVYRAKNKYTAGYLFLCIKIGCRASGEILALK
jgi:hypothetical protein